jgi:hypothetical protein
MVIGRDGKSCAGACPPKLAANATARSNLLIASSSKGGRIMIYSRAAAHLNLSAPLHPSQKHYARVALGNPRAT